MEKNKKYLLIGGGVLAVAGVVYLLTRPKAPTTTLVTVTPATSVTSPINTGMGTTYLANTFYTNPNQVTLHI